MEVEKQKQELEQLISNCNLKFLQKCYSVLRHISEFLISTQYWNEIFQHSFPNYELNLPTHGN